MNRQLRILTVPLVFLGVIGCNGAKYNFSEKPEPLFSEQNGGAPAPPNVGQPSQRCSTQLNNMTVSAKILFIVDTSGSNATENNGQGTDKDKSFRKGSIQKFFDDYSGKTNFNWGFVTFSYGEATSYIGDSFANPSMFSSNPSEMQSALNKFGTAYDEGDTPYVAAIRKASDAIAQDAPVSAADAKYIVVFVSDGLPSPSVANDVIYSEISTLMSKAPGRISFNTIYYGIPSVGGGALMQGMANVGSGQFLDTNISGAGRSFPISNVVQVPGTVCEQF